LNFVDGFAKNTRVSKLMNVYSVGAELFHADGRTDRRTSNTRFSQVANAD